MRLGVLAESCTPVSNVSHPNVTCSALQGAVAKGKDAGVFMMRLHS